MVNIQAPPIVAIISSAVINKMAASRQFSAPRSPIVNKTKDIFISYGREEGVREFVKQLKADLEANGVSVWLDADDIPTGSEFHVEIGVALKACRALIPVLTKKYVQSRYCKGELYVAYDENKALLPVIYEDGWDEGEKGAGVNYVVKAFNWAFFRPNQDNYQESLNRLINGAKLNLKQSDQPVIQAEGGTAASERQAAFTSMAAAVKCVEKWQELGHQLNISPEMLSNLFNSGQSGAECRDEMVAYWEKHDNDASWEKLARALARMGENQLAERIIEERRIVEVEGGGGAVTYATPTQNNPTTVANAEASSSDNVVIGDLVICCKEIIGQGAFGTVFKGQWQGRMPCAAKMLSILGNEVYTGVSLTRQNSVQEEVLAKFKWECDFMKTLRHPNIVAYYDTLFHPGSNLPVLVMELMDTSLRQHLTKMENLSIVAQFNLSCNIAAALEFLHSKSLVHRDLCGDNILLKHTSDVHLPVAKVTDFGMSRLMIKRPEMTHSLTAIGHRPGYLPHEAGEFPTDYDESLDVFMFGAVMTQIASKAPTIKSEAVRQQLVNQLGANGHPLKPIISLCLDERKNRRPSSSKICTSLKAACESLSAGGMIPTTQAMDSIVNKMQQLCLDAPSVKNGNENPDGAVQSVSAQIREFMKKFESLVLSCLCELEETQLGLRKFRTSLMLLPASIKHEHTAFLKENLPTFLKAENLEEIFMHLNLYWNFIDYSLLDYIVDRFCGADLKKDMHEYKLELGVFRRVTTISQVIGSWPGRVDPPPSFTEFTSTLDRDASTFTLEELEELRVKICNEFSLSNFILMFRGVVKGSLVITWFVPTGIVPKLRDDVLTKAKSRSPFFQENAVVSIFIDGECVSMFLPEVQTPTSSVVSSKYKKAHSEVVFTGETMTQLQEQIESLMEENSEPLWKHQSITEEFQWEIYVRTLTGKIITICCNESDLIADIKSRIEKKEGIPLLNQQLVKRETHNIPELGTQIVNIELNDGVSLAEYKIQNYQELILMRIAPTMHSAAVPMAPGVAPVMKVPELATINVQSSAGQKYTIKMDLNAPVSEVKAVLCKRAGFEQGEQRLIFAGKELQNDQILCQCNVRDGSILHLVMVHFRDRVVYIKMLNGKSFPLECKANNTIGTIKAMIHDEEYIPADQQRLVFAGQGLDDDRKTLSDYNIEHGDVIHLAFKRGGSLPLSRIDVGKIFVKAPYHAPMRVDVHKNDTIATVKTKVQRILVDLAADEQVEFPEFIPHEQELMIAGKRLNNEQVLGELGIKDGDTLHLLFTQRQHSLEEIVIKTFSGDSFRVQVTPDDTVENVKVKIHERQRISPESQKIKYAGRELENHTRLGDLNVHTSTTFYLEVIQPPKIFVKPLMGEAMALDFDPNVTVAEVKSGIQEKLGISSNQISLLFGGKELDDEQVLSSYGIQDKSTIYMYSTIGAEPILFVKVPSLQKTILLDYDPEETVRSVKRKLLEKEQISFDQQKLLFEGVHLEDNKTLGSYDIPHEGTIDLIVTETKDSIDGLADVDDLLICT